MGMSFNHPADAVAFVFGLIFAVGSVNRGSFLAAPEAGNSNRVVGLLRMVAKGVK